MKTTAASLVLAFVLACIPSSGLGLDLERDASDIEFSRIAETFRGHCVRVYVQGKSHNGKLPPVGEFAGDILAERPTLVGGYWWDDRHVVVEDQGLQDDYIRSIEISPSGSDTRYPARVAGRFVKMRAALLEVLPDTGGLLPKADPLVFADGDPNDAYIFTYLFRDGEWQVETEGCLGAMALTDSGRETSKVSSRGVWMTQDGEAIGLAMGDDLAMGDAADAWCGEKIRSSPLVTAEESRHFNRELGDKLRKTVLEVRFGMRVKFDEEDEESSWSVEADGMTAGAAEIRAAGLVVGPHHLLVPISLHAEAIARIEEMTVVLPDGKEVSADFAGALREYLAVLVSTDVELPSGEAPDGFSLLDPLVLDVGFDASAALARRPEGEYFVRRRIDYRLGRRRESMDYDRWVGYFRGYRGDPVVETMTNEEAGSMAFDRAGRLAALALAPRVVHAQDAETREQMSVASFRPVDYLYQRLRRDEVFDPALRPVDEDEGRRLIDLGVEYQELDPNTSRLFSAAGETRGGEIGMLVNHVYPGFAADRMGIREGDILLRIAFEDTAEPKELKASDDSGSSSFGDMSTSAVSEALSSMSTPWPSRDNSLSSLLTTAGVGRKATLEYLRDGEVRRTEFVTSYSEPDYRNAKKHRFPALGLTVKPITYEVARFFKRPNPEGVIISKVEEGGKAAVAGLHQYLLVTRVDGKPVTDVEDFRNRMEEFEAGGSGSVELMAEGFGKTKLVRMDK